MDSTRWIAIIVYDNGELVIQFYVHNIIAKKRENSAEYMYFKMHW